MRPKEKQQRELCSAKREMKGENQLERRESSRCLDREEWCRQENQARQSGVSVIHKPKCKDVATANGHHSGEKINLSHACSKVPLQE